MSESWVVTYWIEHKGGGELFEAYRGSKRECIRIARHSASPMSHKGKQVLAFKTIIGTASSWDKHLRDEEEAIEQALMEYPR